MKMTPNLHMSRWTITHRIYHFYRSIDINYLNDHILLVFVEHLLHLGHGSFQAFAGCFFLNSWVDRFTCRHAHRSQNLKECGVWESFKLGFGYWKEHEGTTSLQACILRESHEVFSLKSWAKEDKVLLLLAVLLIFCGYLCQIIQITLNLEFFDLLETFNILGKCLLSLVTCHIHGFRMNKTCRESLGLLDSTLLEIQELASLIALLCSGPRNHGR